MPSGPWFCRKCESQERAARVVSAANHLNTCLARTQFTSRTFHLTHGWLLSCLPLLQKKKKLSNMQVADTTLHLRGIEDRNDHLKEELL